MPLVNAKCTNCGANLKIDDTKDAAICEYCGSAFIVEKAINNYNVNVSNTNNITADVVNVYEEHLYSSPLNAFHIENPGKLTAYYGYDTDVVIPEIVKTIESYSFDKNEMIKSISIPNSVEKIEQWAFSGCKSLQKVVLSDKLSYIGMAAFGRGCDSLEEVTVPTRLQQEITSGSEPINGLLVGLAFRECKSLKSVQLPNGITEIQPGAFENCTSLQEVQLPVNLKILSGFKGCTSLETIDIPEGVTTIGVNAFSGCTNLKTIHLPNSVKKIDEDAFVDCVELSSINLSEEMEIEEGAFAGCKKLEPQLASMSISIAPKNKLKAQYEEMLAKEQAANQPKQKTEIDILRNAKCSAYELRQSPKSLEAIELIKSDKWKKTSDISNLKAKNYINYNKNGAFFNIELEFKKRITTDEGKEFFVESKKNQFCSTSRTTSSESLSKMAAKKLCLEKAEECFDILRQKASEQIEYVEASVVIDISDSGTHRSQRIVLFRDGYYYISGTGLEYWIDFIKQVNGD